MQSIYLLIVCLISFFTSCKVSHFNGNKYPANISNEKNKIPEAINSFAFEILSKLSEDTDKENIFLSPYSIFSGMAIAYTGAENETKNQIARVFHFNDNKSVFLNNYRSFNEGLLLRDSAIKMILKISNSAWIENNYLVKPSYTNAIKEYLDVEVHRMNVTNIDSQEYSRKQINLWIENQTTGKIKDLIKPSVPDNITRLLLINTIYFKNDWKNSFRESDTRDDLFFLQTGENVKTKYLHREGLYRYYQNTDIQAIEIPYKNERFSMIAILPLQGNKSGMEEVNEKVYQKVLDSLKNEEVDLWLPRFKTEASYELNKILAEMKMPDAFNEKADFSEITGNKELYISNVIHKALIDVSETGTEASASSAVVMKLKSARIAKIFKADHPFLFMIIEKQSNTILFIGKLNHPSK
jgi:serpin B